MFEILAAIISLAGLAIVTFVGYAFNQLITKKIDDLTSELEKRSVLFFKKLDENRIIMENSYVRKDICKVMHEQTSTGLTGLEVRINNRMDKLESKFDQISEMLVKILAKGGND